MKSNLKYVTWIGTVLLSIGILSACGENMEPTTQVTPKEVGTKTQAKTEDTAKYLYENDAFRIEAVEVQEGGKTVTVRGQASVYESNVLYSVEDGHYILDKGYTMASNVAPNWGAFEFTVQIKDKMPANNLYVIMLYEEDVNDGSWNHTLEIPIEFTKND